MNLAPVLMPAATVWQRTRAHGPVHEAPAWAPAGIRVLIVDGDPVHSALLVLALEHFGVSDAVVVGAAGEALALLAATPVPFTLVVADPDLPDMDGMLFLRRAAGLGRCKVALASALEPGRLAALRGVAASHGVPVCALLAKPIELDGVAGVLAACARGPVPLAPAPALAARRWSRQELAAAFHGDQFEPHFQPLCSLDSGRCTAVEILARWRHPGHGLLEADSFIACLEREGMLDTLCETLLSRSLQWVRLWERDGLRLGLALNASPLSMQQSGFCLRMAALCARHDFEPGRVTLELTETALASDDAALSLAVTRLREAGFKVAIDDFGVGYSSLQRLAELPFTEIKIDRGFVRRSLVSAKGRAILGSVCALAQRLGLDCVAEGIEDPQQLALLREMGCANGQGYLFAAPMPGAALAAWCRQPPCLPREYIAAAGIAGSATLQRRPS